MTNEEILKLKAVLKKYYAAEINVSLIERDLNVSFKKANYIIGLLERDNIISKTGKLKITLDKIDGITLEDDSIVKHLDLVEDALAIIKRDKKFDAAAVEKELNVRSNLMFDLIQELMRMNVIERYEDSYRVKE